MTVLPSEIRGRHDVEQPLREQVGGGVRGGAGQHSGGGSRLKMVGYIMLYVCFTASGNLIDIKQIAQLVT